MTEESYDHKIIVPGEPMTQQRHRSVLRLRKGSHGPLYQKSDFFIQMYDPSVKDKENFRRKVIPFDEPLVGPLKVDLCLYYARLKGHFGTGRNSNIVKASAPLWKTTYPDIDNAMKIVFDTLNGHIWKDDAIICSGSITKQYAEKPRTEIYITKLNKQCELF